MNSNLILLGRDNSPDVVGRFSWSEGLYLATTWSRDIPSRALKDAQMADSGTFLDINHFLGRVKSLNLFLRHVITSVHVVKGLEEAIRNKSL